jgi:hypothetical protein
MKRQQIAIPCAAEDGAHLGLLCWGHLGRWLTAQGGRLETGMWVNIQRITRASPCTNVVWPDLGETRALRYRYNYANISLHGNRFFGC